MRTTFQKEPTQLQRQQEILTALGFYTGKIDGLWGPSSIAAMIKFEASPTFLPGIPNHGMPLGDTAPWPANISKDLDVKRNEPILLTHPSLVQQYAPSGSGKVREGLVALPQTEETLVKDDTPPTPTQKEGQRKN